MDTTEEMNSESAAGAGGQKAQSLREALDTPITHDEAQRLLADIDVQQAQLSVLRLRLLDQLNQVDLQLAQASFDRSVIIRRALNVETDGSDA